MVIFSHNKEYMMITLNLSLAEVNVILNALGRASYVEVAPVIEVIKSQAAPQLKKQNNDDVD